MNRFYRTELRRSLRASLLAIVILALSFLGPVVADILRSSVAGYLKQNSRRILTADIAVTAYRPITNEELDRVRRRFEILRETRETEFVTMTSGRKDRSALLEVHAVDREFPIDGEFLFADGRRVKHGPQPGEVWLSSEALAALEVERGDSVNLGQLKVKVTQDLAQAPGVGRAAFGFAPRAYIARSEAEKTGLLGFGSQIFYRVYLELKSAPSTEAITEALADPDLFIRTPDDSIQGLERFTGFISLYLSIVSVTLFALGWVGAFYILRAQAISRIQTTAVAIVFGANRQSTLRFEFIRVLGLTLFAQVIAVVLAIGLTKAFEPMVAEALLRSVPGGQFQMSVSVWDVLGLTFLSVISAIVFTLPFAARLRNSRLVELFADSPIQSTEVQSGSGGSTRPWVQNFVIGLLAILILWMAAAGLTQSSVRGAQLAIGLAAAGVVLYFGGVGAFRMMGWIFGRIGGAKGALLRLVAVQLTRARFAVRLSFLAIGLSTFVGSAVGQIMTALGHELAAGANRQNTPDFFVFNIPEADLEPLKSRVASFNSKLDFLSPMILARLKTANGKPITNERFAKFPVRITWREKLISSEELVRGESLPAVFDSGHQALPYLSVEAKFAEQNDFAIGDRLGFDVQGVPIEGEIRNWRRVRWTDFNPNFFISFQGGVLDDAPKTWLANIKLKDKAVRSQVQANLVREFPDLSVIDVGQTLEKISGLIQGILGPAEASAFLAGAFSILILLTIVGHSTQLRSHEMNLFRILGAQPQRVRALYRFEFALAAATGATLGTALGIGLAAIVAVRFLEVEMVVDWRRALATALVGLILGWVIGEGLYLRVARGLGIDRRVV